MALGQVAISVCNDGNVSQLDVQDQVPGGIYYRIEVYRASQPSGGYGVTLSGSRVEDICGADHLGEGSNRVFRYAFSGGDRDSHKGDLPVLLEGREELNPPGMPDGSWDIRIRDVDSHSTTYGSIIHSTVVPTGPSRSYDVEYGLRLTDPSVEKVPIRSPLSDALAEINPDLGDLSADMDKIGTLVEGADDTLAPKSSKEGSRLSLSDETTSTDIDDGLQDILRTISSSDFALFRNNLDLYEAFGDFGSKAVHPGTNLVGPNAQLAAESIFVRQYRAALVLLGRVSSPDMARGADEPQSLAKAPTNTRPGVYANFVGAAINHIGIYKLGLDKVHSDYGGVPMELRPGSRLESDAKPLSDAWRGNQTLGEVADMYYLAGASSAY